MLDRHIDSQIGKYIMFIVDLWIALLT